MYEKIVLENGLRVILVPKEEAKTVAILVFVKIGTDYESKDLKGIYHFIEHLPFKGTMKRPLPEQITKAIEAKGGQMNAFTEEELMVFLVRVASDRLELGFDVLSDMMMNPLFNSEEIEREKKVVIEEINRQKDDIERYLALVLWNEVVYGDQPAGWPTVGTKETIRATNRRVLFRFFNKHFNARNMVISVAGNFDPTIVKSVVKEYFSGLRTGISSRKPKLDDSQANPHVLVSYKKPNKHILV